MKRIITITSAIVFMLFAFPFSAFSENVVLPQFTIRDDIHFGMTFKELYENEQKRGFTPTNDYLYDAGYAFQLYYQRGIYVGDVFCTRLQYDFDVQSMLMYRCQFVSKGGKEDYTYLQKYTKSQFGSPESEIEKESTWNIAYGEDHLIIQLNYNEYNTVFLTYSYDLAHPIIRNETAQIQFGLRNGISFGASKEEVIASETLYEAASRYRLDYGDLQYRGTVFDINNAIVSYMFDGRGALKEMLYKFSSENKATTNEWYDSFQKQLKKEYGDPLELSDNEIHSLKGIILTRSRPTIVESGVTFYLTQWLVPVGDDWVKIDLCYYSPYVKFNYIFIDYTYFTAAEFQSL